MKLLVVAMILFVAAPFVRVATQEPQARATHWPNGQIKTLSYVVRDADGEFVRSGLARRWYEDGKPTLMGDWKDDLREGKWVWFNTDGEPVAICLYSRDRGEYRDLFPDGSVLREGALKGTNREGRWREYYPSGRVRLEGEYRNNLRHGKWTVFTDSDTPRTRVQMFRDDKPVEEGS